MKSTLAIDGILQDAFSFRLDTFKKYEELKRVIIHYDFQDTECNNETECYFYFSNNIPMEKVREYGLVLHKMLGIDDINYKWMIEDQTEEGNPEIRLEIICSLDI